MPQDSAESRTGHAPGGVGATPLAAAGGADPFEGDAHDRSRVRAAGRARALAWLGGGPDARRALAAMLRAGALRAAAPRVYFRPRATEGRFGPRPLNPRPEEVARAFCEERGWQMAPGEAAAQNMLGLSTQVPARLVVAASGCTGHLWLYGGRLLVEPAPEEIAGQPPAACLLIQGTRAWATRTGFRFPPPDPWSARPRSARAVAAAIAARATPDFLADLARALPAIPRPHRGLARAVLASARPARTA